MTLDIDKLISSFRLRIRMKSPFFATLSLLAHFKPTYHHPTAATDGKDIFFNPDFFASLTPAEQEGVLLHELLHAALLHVTRRGQREAILWNIAADIIVNGLIAEQNVFTLPSDALREPKWEKLSVEEIYTLLMQQENHPQLPNFDLLSQPPEDAQGDKGNSNGSSDNKSKGKDTKDNNFNANSNGSSDDDSTGKNTEDNNFSSLSQAQKEALDTHWKNALQQATLIARSTNQGTLPAGLERQLKELSQAQLDWRTYLWRYLVQTPTDFQGFDRRFVGRGLYLDTIAGESVQVFVAVDTSGSVGEQELKLFLSEVQGILGAYPHLKCILYYTDAEAYGPYSLTSDSSIPQPVGGGGTSFVPFFNKVESIRDFDTQGVCVYLTDGYGTFPTDIPNLPVLWVVTPGGLDLEQFPFGEAVRLLNHF